MRIIIVILFSVVICCCQKIDMHGQYIDNASVIKLQQQRLTKSEVEALIGTPTMMPYYSPDTWYYVHRTIGRRAWFNPKILEQKIVCLKFNKENIIENVEILDNGQDQNINIVTDYTPSYGTDQSGFKTFVKNIGRFNKTTDGKHKSHKKKNKLKN